MGMQLLAGKRKSNGAPNCRALGLTNLFRLLFASCSLLAFVGATQAQQPDFWVKFAPVDDFFSVSMPHRPKEESQAVSFAGLQVSAKVFGRYADAVSRCGVVVQSRRDANAPVP